MNIRYLLLAAVCALGGVAHTQEAIPRTADGHPDFQGAWESRWLTPLERIDGTTEAIVSGEAAAAYAVARTATFQGPGVALHPDDDFDFVGLLPAGNGAFRTSLIVEPADGKRPQTQLAKDLSAKNRDIRKAAENPEGLSNDERCLSMNGRTPLGVSPGSMLRQIIQTPGNFVIYTEDQMVSRVIGIDASPRPAALMSSAGDSIATWEGDTLVVVTTNIQPQLAPPGGPVFNLQRRVTEHFNLLAPDRISYDYVLEDTAMLTQPLRVQYDLIRTKGKIYESACHEGNYSLPGMMRGARFEEQRAGTKAKPKARPQK
jgi:hypothetical protein